MELPCSNESIMADVFSRFKEAIPQNLLKLWCVVVSLSFSLSVNHATPSQNRVRGYDTLLSSRSEGSELKHILQLYSLGFLVFVVFTCRAALQEAKII